MNIPKLRFKEFTDEWKKEKFKDFSYYSGKRNRNNLPLIAYSITNTNGFVPQTEAHNEFGYMKNTDRTAYNIVTSNSFAYNPARINVGSIGYYSGKEDIIVSSLYEVFKLKNYINDKFIWYWLKSEKLPYWINKLQEGSVRQYFYYDKLCETFLYHPSLREQIKISKTLELLDKKIELQTKKIEALKLFKKGLIKKFFSENNLKQIKIKEIGEIITGTTPSKSVSNYWDNGNIIWVTPTDINDNRDINDSIFKITYNGLKNGKFIPKNSILVTCIASIGKNAILKVDGSCNQQINAIIPNKNYNYNYIYYLMEFISNYMKSIAGTSATAIINKDDFSKIVVKVHSKERQDYIDSILSQFEDKVLLEKSRLKQLTQLKKGLMQNMFV